MDWIRYDENGGGGSASTLPMEGEGRRMKNQSSYQPIIPNIKIVRTRGIIHQTAIVIIWLRWVWNIEL